MSATWPNASFQLETEEAWFQQAMRWYPQGAVLHIIGQLARGGTRRMAPGLDEIVERIVALRGNAQQEAEHAERLREYESYPVATPEEARRWATVQRALRTLPRDNPARRYAREVALHVRGEAQAKASLDHLERLLEQHELAAHP